MDYGYIYEDFDLQLDNILHKYLKIFSCQNNDKPLSFDDVLKHIFNSDQIGHEVNNEDKELCEKCILEVITFISGHPLPSMHPKLHVLLNMIKYMSRDETCFIFLNMNGILHNVLYITQPSEIVADRSYKVIFLQWVWSSLEHQTGVKWIADSQCWMNQYRLVLEHESDKEIANLGYDNLTKLLEKLVDIDEKIFRQILQTMIKPLMEKTSKFKRSNSSTAQINKDIRSSMVCLLEILERLLKNYSQKVLTELINCKIGVISDNIAQDIDDCELSLVLERISIMLSFFGLSEVFDGIQIINQDPLVVSGFINLIDNYVEKGNIARVLELYHYGIKYSKYISDKLPKYNMKGKSLEIECEILTLQLEPIILLSEKTKNYFFAPKNNDSIRMSHLAHVIKKCSLESLQVGSKIKKMMLQLPLEIYTLALEGIIKTKELYSPENLGGIFESLVYSFDDLLNYIKINEGLPRFGAAQELYVDTLFTAVFTYIEEFSSDWGDRVKALDLPQIMFDFLSSYDWPKGIVVKALVLTKIAISKRLCPCMSLLIDTPDSIKDLGPLLYRKCFNSEWEIRKAVLEVICIIANNANKSFSSFKGILEDSSLPNLVSTMALNDENPLVKAIAFKCLQEFIVMEDIEHTLTSKYFINKVLEIITKDDHPAVQSEAIQFIQTVYKDQNLPMNAIVDIYKCMEQQALYNNNLLVRKAAVEFWKRVTSKVFAGQGWIDCKFPSIVFSKRIVTMTKMEIRTRIYKILTELSNNGCLKVLRHLFENSDVHEEVADIIRDFFKKMQSILIEYEITPESMLINNKSFQAPLHQSILQKSNIDSDQLMQEILNEATMTMFSDDLNFCTDEDLLSVFDNQGSFQSRRANDCSSSQNVKSMTPYEFVEFVYTKMSSVPDEKDYNCFENITTSNNSDTLNIIDY